MPILSLTKTQLKEAAVKLYSELCQGKSDREVMELMGIDEESYQHIKNFMFDARAEQLRSQSTERVYLQYIIDQEQNVRDLNDMIGMFRFNKQYGALVGAVRLRSEIRDKVVEKGQEFGLLARAAEETVIRGGVVVSHMSSSELKNLIAGELESMNKMISEASSDGDILDVVPVESLYYDLPASDAPKAALSPVDPQFIGPSASEKAARKARIIASKVGKGRRRVREKAVANQGSPSDMKKTE